MTDNPPIEWGPRAYCDLPGCHDHIYRPTTDYAERIPSAKAQAAIEKREPRMTITAKDFRKKPVVIQAMQFNNWSDAIAIQTWADGVYYVGAGYEHPLRRENESDRSNGHILDDAPAYLVVKTLEGDHRADIGDWIIRGVVGEFYPCKPAIFADTYDAAVTE